MVNVMTASSNFRRVSRLEIIIVTFVLLASLAARLVGLDAFRVADEARWTCRVIGFRDALRRGDWANTFRVGHPGVMTMWLGAAFAPAESAGVRDMCQASLDGRQLEKVGGSQAERHQLLVALNRLLLKARVGVALFSWACIVGVYVLTRLLWGPKVSVLSLVLVGLDPFYLAMSRFLHLDAVLTGAMTVSVLCLLVSLDRSRSQRWHLAFLALSGVVGGLAILQKTPAMFLGLFVALVEGLDALRGGIRRERLLRAARNVAIWGLVAAAVYVALWPAMWVNPVGTMQGVLAQAIGYAEEGHSSGSYFFGRPVDDPGWLFYPVALAFRLSPLVLAGLIAGVVWVARSGNDAGRRFGVGVLLAYSVLFGLFMSLGAKKFDRYLLPVFPALDIVAAVGLLWVVEVAWQRLRRLSSLRPDLFITVIVVAIQVALVTSHYPYYLTYYNPLLGGIRQAAKVLLVGWGEGYERAAAYLNAKPDVERLQVSEAVFPVFAPQFDGETRRLQRYCVWDNDYVIFYLSYVQRQRFDDLLVEYMDNPDVAPEYVVNLHGVDYLWIYRNDQHYVEPMAYIEERAQQGECLLVNGDSLFAENYGGQLPVYAFHAEWVPEDESYVYWSAEQVAGFLEDMSPECERVWYARYSEWEPEAYLDVLNMHGALLGRASFPHMEVTLHQLVGADAATRPADAQFGGLRLKGYGVTQPPPAWGRDGGVVLAWEATQEMAEDYAIFLHLYDARGERVAQEDEPILDRGLQQTSQWEAGTSSVALYHLPIGPGTPPGEYDLELGVYQQETGERLPLEGAQGETSVRMKVEVGVAEKPPTLEELGVPHVMNRGVIPELRLVGYGVDQEAVLAGQAVTLRVVWEGLGRMAQAYRLAVDLLGADGRVYGGGEYELVGTEYATTEWREGEVLRGVYDVAVSEGAPTGEMTLTVNLVGENGELALEEPVTLGVVWVQSTERTFDVPLEMEELSGVMLGDEVKLLGYDLAPGPVQPGGNLYVTLYWQGQREMEKSYKVFVHVYDGEGNIVAQRDWLPGLGVKPTSGWEMSEVVADRHIVPVEEGVAAGKYEVAVGMYEEGSGERLAAYGPDGERLDQDRIILGRVEVEP
jgi:4-amino-4-deoxy-L-arabinose transferase-like glycosyltransferase